MVVGGWTGILSSNNVINMPKSQFVLIHPLDPPPAGDSGLTRLRQISCPYELPGRTNKQYVPCRIRTA